MSKNRLPYMPIDTTVFLSATRHLRTREVAEFMLVLITAWGRAAKPVPTRRELIKFYILPETCERIIRYDMHPSAWPDGKWSVVREAVIIRDGHRCTYCGIASGPFDVDHIKPRSRGGKNSAQNLTTSCVHCNRQKGARTPEEWMGAR